jgi:hypothetical protein
MTFGRLTGIALALASAFGPSVTGCSGSTTSEKTGGAPEDGAVGGSAGVAGSGGAGGVGGAPPGGGGWSACFAAGTPIATPSGEVAIERLRVGDLVLAYDQGTHRVVPRPVVRTFAHPDQRPGRLTLEDGRVLEVTDNHPIYRPDRNDYADAGDILENTRLLLLRGVSTDSGIATGFQADAGALPQTVYNIEVAEEHNYFAANVLVHNKSGGSPPCSYEKKQVDGTQACQLDSECLDPDPATFEPLFVDGGAPDAGTDDAGTDHGSELQRYFCSEPNSDIYYPVAFELESPSPYEDYVSLISSPTFSNGTGGSGPCSGLELGQIWNYYPEGNGTDGWQTYCTMLYGADLNEHLSIWVQTTTAKLRNLRFVQACDCQLSQKKWNSCNNTYTGVGGASYCE